MGDDINYRKILKEKKIYNIGNFEQKKLQRCQIASILYKTNKNNDR